MSESKSLMFCFNKRKMKWFGVDIGREGFKLGPDMVKKFKSGIKEKREQNMSECDQFYEDVRLRLKGPKFKTIAAAIKYLEEVLAFAEAREINHYETMEWQIAKRQEAEKRLEDYKKERKLILAGDLVASHRSISQGMAGVALANERLAKLISELP